MGGEARRRALVTGATGGLGLSLVEALLDKGYAVRATGRDPGLAARLEATGAEVVLADLEEDGAAARLCEAIDVVFHAAALSSPWGPPTKFRRINVDATARLLAAAQAAGADAFVFVSSPSIYARSGDQIGLTEADPPAVRPINDYAATKGEAERLVLAANRDGFATVSIRPRAIVGPDDRVLLPRILRLARRGSFPVLRGGRALVELTDVRDAVEALILADARRAYVNGRAFNISGGRPVEVRDLLVRLGEALGRPVRMRPIPIGLAMTMAGAMEAVCTRLPGRPEPPLTRYGVAALGYSQTFNLAGALDGLGYVPRHDPLEAAAAMARAAR